MKRKERFFGILLSLVLMLVLMAGMSLSAHAETTYNVWVGGVQVTSANMGNVLADDPVNNGRVSFAPATETTPATLTLDGATITSTHYSDSYYGAAIYAQIDSDLTVNVTADSTVTGPPSAGSSYGVYNSADSLTVTGSGTLTAEGGTATGDHGSSCGVYVSGGAVIVTGKLTAAGGTSTYNVSCGVLTSKTVYVNGTLIATGGTATNGASYGVSAKKGVIVDTGAKLTAEGDTQTIDGNVRNAIAGTGWTNAAGTGGMANIDVSADARPLPNYKKVQFPALYDVWVGGVQVTSANMNDVLGSADGDDATVTYTPATETTPATLTLNGATITSGSHNYAAIFADGDLTIDVTTDSTVTGPEADDSYGVINSGGSLTVTGSGELTAEGSTATNGDSIGVYLYNGAVTVNGKLTAEGGTATLHSLGVLADSVTVNGTLIASGGTATNDASYGVSTNKGVIVDTGAKLTAAGGTRAISGSVRNAIAGTGWTNAAGTGGMANIAANDQGQTLNNYKKVRFPAVVTYPVWVGGVQVTSANMGNVLADDPVNNGKVSFAPAEGTTPATLTLDDATITSGSYRSAAIYAESDLTIDVTEDSTVTGPEADYSYGVINSSGSLTVTGSGKLTAEGSTATYGDSIGVYVYNGAVTVNGKLTAAGSTAKYASCGVRASGAVTVNGKLTAEGGTATLHSFGVFADSVTVNGTLTAEGGTATNLVSCGVSAQKGVIVDTGAKLTAAGDTRAIDGSVKNAIAGTGWTNAAGTEGMANIAANDQGQTLNNYKKVRFPGIVLYPVWVGGVQVTELNMADVLGTVDGDGATVTYTPAATGENPTPATLTLSGAEITSGSYRSAAIYAEGDLTINVTVDSIVTGPRAGSSYGVYVYKGSVTVSGKLTATGGTATGNNGSSYGVFVFDGSVTVAEGGTLTAAGGEAGAMSFGVSALSGDVTVAEGGELTATGGTAKEAYSSGVYVTGGAVTVNGKLTAEGGTATNHSLGVSADSVTVNGTLTAAGGTSTHNVSWGVLTSKTVTVNGTLIASGGTATNGASYGVSANKGVIVDTGAKLTAAGDTQAIDGSVKNAIAGNGWTDAAGTEGKANIPVNTDGQTLEYRKVLFPELPAATVTTEPTAKTLKYTGQGQELVNAGAADGGTMYYAIGTASEATGDYAAAIPTATATGTHYVWYKVVGDANHNDTQAAKVTVTVGKADVTAPTIASKAYTGRTQTADVAASTLYSVTANNGGTNVGSYDVVLTLTDSANYKWTDSTEAAKTLSFRITKATANTVTVSIEGWTYGEAAKAPTSTATFGTAEYTYAVKGSADFSAAVPTNAGEYTVKASIAETANYNGAEATADFTIAKKIPAAGVDFTVEALQLTYTGVRKELVRQTILTDGLEIKYSFDNGASVETGLPMKKASGVYQICYRVIGNDIYETLGWSGPVTATITMYATFSEPDFALPPFLAEIGEEAFAEDMALTTVDAGSCAKIGANAFRGCTNLKRIRLSQNCEIDDTAFTGCMALKIFAPAGGTTAAWCAGHNINFVAE